VNIILHIPFKIKQKRGIHFYHYKYSRQVSTKFIQNMALGTNGLDLPMPETFSKKAITCPSPLPLLLSLPLLPFPRYLL
jgi:hypothetical protein